MSDVVSGDFDLTFVELRRVASFVLECAEPLLLRYEADVPDDDRPRKSLEAARPFVGGQRRTVVQRVASLDAHRAATAAPTEVAKLAAQAAGDAASAAYLHPIHKGHQVGHILRAAANAARIAEIDAGDDESAGERSLRAAASRVDSMVRDVLSRYPLAPEGRSRASHWMCRLDAALRTTSEPAGG